MSHSTLRRRGRSTTHIKQSSFDVSELAAAGRVNNSTHSDMPLLSGGISPLNPFKRLSQFFKRQTSEPTSLNKSTSPENQIFGQCLSKICNPELPKPIKDLLTFLQDVGPFTREIFRKPPNARKCRLLAEKLNSPTFYWEVDESCNGLLLAAVLKTFLREIPNKVCDDRLFSQWSAIFQNNDNHDVKIVSIQRLISRLPEGNRLLLKQLISVLYRIQQRASDNLMSSYNISICLGPCLLWTKSSSCREAEKASKIVPKIVQFLIDNCCDLFGRDILKQSPQTDSALAKQTSKSLDSIFTEKPNRYIDIEGLTNQLSRQQMSPSRLSYDSGLILDDMSHDEESTNDTKTSTPIHKRFDLSYDSLDCDECVFDEEISEHDSKHNNNNTNFYVNTSELAVIKSQQQLPDELDSSMAKRSVGSPYSFKTPVPLLTTAHKRNTVQVMKRVPRPSVLPPLLERKPSVVYDKITYRYISDSHQQVPAPVDKFYSLPRPGRRSHAAVNIPHNLEHKLQSSSSKTTQQSSQLASTTCGQPQWKSADIPLIIVDTYKTGKQSDMEQHIYMNSKTQWQRQKPTVNKNSKTNLLPVPESIYQNTGTNNRRSLDIPIYENSELYGPSPTMNGHRLTQGPNTSEPDTSAPLYENLPFHRQPPIVRQRRRTLNTPGNYSTYRQQTYTGKTRSGHENSPQQTINRSPTISGADHSLNKCHSQPANSRQFLHETCYFV